ALAAPGRGRRIGRRGPPDGGAAQITPAKARRRAPSPLAAPVPARRAPHRCQHQPRAAPLAAGGTGLAYLGGTGPRAPRPSPPSAPAARRSPRRRRYRSRAPWRHRSPHPSPLPVPAAAAQVVEDHDVAAAHGDDLPVAPPDR